MADISLTCLSAENSQEGRLANQAQQDLGDKWHEPSKTIFAAIRKMKNESFRY
jgi:hypothetical protein